MRVFVVLGILEIMLVICAIVSFLLEVASAVGSIGMANAEMEGGQICRDLAGAMLVVAGEISRPDVDLLDPRALAHRVCQGERCICHCCRKYRYNSDKQATSSVLY